MTVHGTDWRAIIDARTKHLAGTAYKVGPNLYGLDVVAYADSADVNEREMSFYLPVADGNRRDGVGDLLEVQGIDTSRHARNPISLFDHGKQVQIPLGLFAERSGDGKYDIARYTFRSDPQTRMAGGPVFVVQGEGDFPALKGEQGVPYDHFKFCEQFFHLWAKGLIRAGSIGYQVVHAQQLPANYETGVPQGLHLQRVLMLEGSAVVLPANADTTRKSWDIANEVLALPAVCGKPLSPVLVKSLSCYAGEKQAKVVGGWEGRGEKMAGDVTPPPHAKTCGALPCDARHGTAKHRLARASPERPESNMNFNRIQSLKELRVRYRKGHRRRLRKSAPGASTLHVREKDIAAAKRLAEQRGLKFAHLGTADGRAKIKLMGDDSSMDAVAKQYGVKSMSAKNMPKRTKELPPDDLPPMDDLPPEDDKGMDEPFGAQLLRKMHSMKGEFLSEFDPYMKLLEHEPTKKYIHGHLERKAQDMEDIEAHFKKHYKELPPLEGAMDADDKDLTEDELEGIEDDLEEEMDDTEEDKDVDGATPADSSEEELPDPEEVVEGMEKEPKKDEKRLKGGKAKALKALSFPGWDVERNVAIDPKRNAILLTNGNQWRAGYYDGNSSGKLAEERTFSDEASGVAYHRQLASRKSLKAGKKSTCPECGKEDCGCKKSLKAKKSDTPVPHGDLTETDVPPPEWEPGEGALKDHELASVGEAGEFAGELSQTQDFGDEHRMKSYHYHKTLKAIGDVMDAGSMAGDMDAVPGQEKGLPGTDSKAKKKGSKPKHAANSDWAVAFQGAIDSGHSRSQAAAIAYDVTGKAMPNPDDWPADDSAPPDQQSHRKACKDASGFFERMSQEKAFGDQHREEAGHWAKQLGSISGTSQEMDHEDIETKDEFADQDEIHAGEDGPLPGDMGEKDLDEEEEAKRLARIAEKNGKTLAHLNRQLTTLNGKF